mmetsp:Transcript_44253/g.53476  ORF Transcript_44253/g.53476 Transcript_44253/m.53476 type:complete len:271 (+) Transcript_44253:125-937(+)
MPTFKCIALLPLLALSKTSDATQLRGQKYRHLEWYDSVTEYATPLKNYASKSSKDERMSTLDDLSSSFNSVKHFVSESGELSEERLKAIISKIDEFGGVFRQFESEMTTDNADKVGHHVGSLRECVSHVHSVLVSLAPKSSCFATLRGSFTSMLSSKGKLEIPIAVGISYECEASLRALSNCLERAFYGSNCGDSKILDFIVRNVATIPNLMKTITLIEDDDDRKRIMDLLIIKWVMMYKESLFKTRGDGGIHHNKCWLVNLVLIRQPPC